MSTPRIDNLRQLELLIDQDRDREFWQVIAWGFAVVNRGMGLDHGWLAACGVIGNYRFELQQLATRPRDGPEDPYARLEFADGVLTDEINLFIQSLLDGNPHYDEAEIRNTQDGSETTWIEGIEGS